MTRFDVATCFILKISMSAFNDSIRLTLDEGVVVQVEPNEP